MPKPLHGVEVSMEYYLKQRVKIHEGHWLWTRCCTRGYGRFEHNGVMVQAHIMSYLTFVGPIPADKPLVLHKRGICHIRKCINPDHLYVGTPQDNMDDMVADERCGGGRPPTIPDDTVRLIREMCAGGILQKVVAAELGISQQHVSRIVNHEARSLIKHEPGICSTEPRSESR
jgi:hypothetical protein